MKISILGTGKVAQALATGFTRNKHEVMLGSRDPAKASPLSGVKTSDVKTAVREGQVIVLAVPYKALSDTVSSVGASNFADKTVIDATNAIGATGELAVGFSTSAAEELAKRLPGAHVVKAFNTIFSRHMSTGKIDSEALALIVAGDDASAKETVMQLGKEIGFEPYDAGGLKSARYLEPLGMLNITLAFPQKLGPGIGFRIVQS